MHKKCICGRGFARYPTGGAFSAHPDLAGLMEGRSGPGSRTRLSESLVTGLFTMVFIISFIIMCRISFLALCLRYGGTVTDDDHNDINDNDKVHRLWLQMF